MPTEKGQIWTLAPLTKNTQGFLQDFTFWGELKDFGGGGVA